MTENSQNCIDFVSKSADLYKAKLSGFTELSICISGLKAALGFFRTALTERAPLTYIFASTYLRKIFATI